MNLKLPFILFISICSNFFLGCSSNNNVTETKKDELTPEECFNIAHDAYKNGEYEKAEEYYSKVIAVDPKSELTFFNRALTNEALNNIVAAIKDYTSAIELNPDYYEAYLNRGACLDENSNYSEAIKDYKMVLRILPDDKLALFNLGNSYFNSNIIDSACFYWKKVEKLGDTTVYKMIDKYCK